MLDVAEDASRGLEVALGGQTMHQGEQGDIGSEAIGFAAAAIILLLMFGSVVAAGLPILVAIAGLAVSSTLTEGRDRVHRRPRLVDLAGHDDGHRHRHRLRAADGHPLPRVAGRRPRPGDGDRGDPGHRRPRRDGRRQHRRHLDAGPLRDGPVVHARRRRRHDPRRAGRDGSPASRSSRRCWATSASTSTGCGSRSGRRPTEVARSAGTSTRRAAGSPGAGWSTATGGSPPSSASACLLALAAPYLDVRYGFPDAGNNVERPAPGTPTTSIAEGFGPGMNGPLLVVAELPGHRRRAPVAGLAALRDATASPR